MRNLLYSKGKMNHIFVIANVGERVDFFLEYCAGKKILHVGCSGFPVMDLEGNLHLKLSKKIEKLYGLDISKEGVEWLRGKVPGRYFLDYASVDESFDVILVPEVMEHVLNPGLFMENIFRLDANEIVMTVPNAIAILQMNSEKFGPAVLDGGNVYIETVHKGHTAYYSPMTLGNTVEFAIDKYGDGKWILSDIFLSGVSVGCIIKRIE